MTADARARYAPAAVMSWYASRLGPIWHPLRKDPLGLAAFAVAGVVMIVAVFADQLAPYDPTRQHLAYRLVAPGANGPNGPFYLGTDEFGRDLLSRIMVGTRYSLGVAVTAVLLGTVVGSALGIVSGYVLGAFDQIVQRIMDSLLAVPTLLFAMVLMSAAGVNLFDLAVVIGVTQIPTTDRIVRSAVLAVREELYVLAAISIGASTSRILIRHILPNVWAPIIVVGTTRLGQAIVIAGSLSFLGYGVPAPLPDWGAMVAAGRNLLLRAPEIVIYPSLAITITVLAFNIAGDTLRDVLDPRMRQR